jgi:hypothetical protein
MKEKMIHLIFAHTSTLGMRETVSRRYTLRRETETICTKYGEIRIKKAAGWGVEKSKPEYEDAARIAAENGISLEEVFKCRTS